MSFTVADLPGFLELLRQHPEWRDSVRYELAGDWLRRAESVERKADQWEIRMNAHFDRREQALDTAITELRAANERHDARFASVDIRFDNIDERFDKVDERFDKVEERFNKMDQRFDGVDVSLDDLSGRTGNVEGSLTDLTGRMGNVEGSLTDLTGRMGNVEGSLTDLTGRMGNVEGSLTDLSGRMGSVESTLTNHTGRFGNLEGAQYEDRYHAASWLATHFRRLAVIATGDVEELLDARDAGVVSMEELNKVTALDFLLRGRDGKGADAPVVYVALEVSLTLASSDIRRAADRAAILRKAGLDARAFAGGRNMPAQLRQLADELAVTILIDQDEAAA